MPSVPRRVSTQVYLLGLVAAVIIPLLVFTGFLLTRYAAAEKARFEREAGQIAHQVTLVIDGELERLLALLKGLAASSALAGGDYSGFHAEALRLVDGRDEIVVLRDLETRQVVNTQRPFGTALPPAVPIAPAELARYRAGKPVISDVYASPISGEPRIAVALSVNVKNGESLVLALTVPTTRIRDVLLPAVPSGWIIGIGDRKGTFVTRSARHEEISGKPGVADYLAKAVGRSGTFSAANFEGVMLLAGYVRSDLSDWLIAANIPQSVVEAPLWRSLAWLAALGVATLALSGLIAFLLGRSFTSATHRLARNAVALGEGRPVPPLVSRLSEFALVGDALANAAVQIEERARERERHEQRRRLLVDELNHRVKNTLATVQSIAQQTLRGDIAPAEARNALTGRLIALARAHDVLTEESWEGAELHDVVAGAVSAHGGPDRFVVTGAPLWLPPALSLSLSLVLHELATNAAKYGALSAEGGTVAIDWKVTGRADALRLTLRWAERGGPPVVPPARQGFGSRLIQASFASAAGTTTVDYAPEGLVCIIDVAVTTPKPATAAV